jgi:hypothetical protein
LRAFKGGLFFLLAGVCIGLSACGGGGSGAGSLRATPERLAAEYDANYGLAAIRASSAYRAGATGRGVRVAVIDTGIDLDHPEFAGAISGASIDIRSGNPGWVDDRNGHGTAVAGVIAARRNGASMHGVAYESTLLAIRAEEGCDQDGCWFNQSDLARATDHAVGNGARVINYSLAGASGLGPAFQAALSNAVAKGAILVFAAGNDGDPNPSYPAMFAASAAAGGQAIAVGAVDAANRIAAFSNRAGGAQNAFLVAPGVGVVTTGKGGGLVSADGTSFAAPHVSGAAAVLLDAAPYLSAKQVADLLLTTATDLGAPGPDAVYGRGLLNLEAALQPQGALVVPVGAEVGEQGAPLEATGLALGAAFGDALSGAALLGDAIFLDGYGRPYAIDLAPAVRVRHSGVDLERWLSGDGEVRTAQAVLAPRIAANFSYEAMDRNDPAADALGGTGNRTVRRFAITTSLPALSTELTASHGYGLSSQFSLGARPEATGLLGERALVSPYLRLAGAGDGLVLGTSGGDGLSVRFGLTEDDSIGGASEHEIERRAYVGELRHDWGEGSHLAIQVGQLIERGSALDTVGDGAFLLGARSETLFFGISGGLSLTGRTELFGAYGIGRTRIGADGGLLRDISTVRSSAFGVGIAGRGVLREADRLALSLSRPLKVTAGSAVLDVPVGRTFEGAVLRRAERVDLVPSGNELDAELSYRVGLWGGHDLRLNGAVRFEPGHVDGADPEMVAAAKYRLAF